MSDFPIHRVRIHGHEVCYRRGGEGPVLLLLHGIAGSSRAWKEVMPLLTRQFTVIAPDLIGHGESARSYGDYSLGGHANGLRDLLAVLGIERATVVGQSFGGGVALQLAYQDPRFCERLVLVDSGGLGREVSLLLRLLTLPGAELTMPVLFPGFLRRPGDAVSRFLSDHGVRSERIAEMWRAYANLIEPTNRQAFLRTMRAVIDPGGQSVSAIDRLYLASHVPTLIIWGDKDEIIPVSHAQSAHEAIPGSRLEIFEGVGHFPHLESPIRFTQVLVDFIESTDPAEISPAEIGALLRSGGSATRRSGPRRSAPTARTEAAAS